MGRVHSELQQLRTNVLSIPESSPLQEKRNHLKQFRVEFLATLLLVRSGRLLWKSPRYFLAAIFKEVFGLWCLVPHPNCFYNPDEHFHGQYTVEFTIAYLDYGLRVCDFRRVPQRHMLHKCPLPLRKSRTRVWRLHCISNDHCRHYFWLSDKSDVI